MVLGARMHRQCPPSCSARGFQGQTAPAALRYTSCNLPRGKTSGTARQLENGKALSSSPSIPIPKSEISISACLESRRGQVVLHHHHLKVFFQKRVVYQVINIFFNFNNVVICLHATSHITSIDVRFFEERYSFMGQHLLHIFDGHHPISQSRLRQEGLSTWYVVNTNHAKIISKVNKPFSTMKLSM